MKRLLWVAFALIVLGQAASRGQVKPGDIGPGDKGATLRMPGLDPTPPPQNPSGPPGVPSYVRNLAPGMAFPTREKKAEKVALPPSSAFAMNRDIEITPEVGAWTILVMPYSGDNAPQMARKFVAELRNQYKLPAYVYNYGAREKQKEFERVQKIRQEQIDALKKAGLKADVPVRVPAMRIEEHTAIFVGGFANRKDAEEALKKVRSLPAPDPAKVDLDARFEGKGERTKSGDFVLHEAKKTYVNPFAKAFVARNPALGQGQGHAANVEDAAFLRRINDSEPYTILKTNKPVTLVIKQFNTQTKPIADEKEADDFLHKFRFMWRPGKWEDVAAQNAHNLAKWFRGQGLAETYVLHCRYCSFVTVGAYDSAQDPRLVAMQNLLESRFRADQFRRLELVPRPVAMAVPR